MKLLRLAFLLAFAAPVFAALKPPSHVKASLVSAVASVQPGHPFTVALRLQHEPHWHTYWLNPGTGLATELKWQLPPGWTAGPIQWPAPVILRDHTGTVVGNGYEGDTLLPVTITPAAGAAPGASAVLKADAEWLMCSDVCIPGNADVSLSLPVSSAAPTPDPAWSAKIRAVVTQLPRPLSEWRVTASRDSKSVTLTVQPVAPPASGQPADSANNTRGHPSDLHFFSDDNLVAYELPQTVVPTDAGGFVLTLPISPDGPQDAKTLHGVVTSESGWQPDGTLRGLRIDAAFTDQQSAVSSSSAGSVSQPSTLNSQPQQGAGLLGTLLLALVGGLILNLMPCVFPVLGIKILGFVHQSGHARSRIVAHGLVFTLGVVLSFWVLAGILAALRAGGAELGWGFQLQSPAFVFALAALMLVFALNMSGVFEFGLRATSVGGELQSRSGLAGSFFTGVLATVVATPCSAPFLAPALGAALALSTAASFAIFTAIALGLSTPYLLLSIFPGAVKILPRPGAWMETFKQFMAFPLYATVGYLVWVLAGQVGDEGFQNVLFGLVLVALGIWFYGRWHQPGASAGRTRFGTIALGVAAASGLWLGWPHAAPAQPAGTVTADGVTWQPWSPDAVAQLRAEGRIVYVDFTARWCATCQANKKLVFHSGDVLRTFAEKKVATLRADWTNKDPRITEELAKYRRSAVPFNLIWFPGRDQPVILPELLTPRTVLDAVNRG
ncbi:MAG TPA: protein-disulfide reductase DsbD domain-containing protein [Opitutus sp.]|nr:protein-disulfide reductase DsbD domain-containing protein [Opitutus sp.]